jgi:DNA-binding NarL/FixJ family response regulator
LRKIFENELGSLKSIIYIYDKVVMFSIPIKNHIVVFSTDRNINIDDVFQQAQSFIKNAETELDLELDVKNITQEKKESVRYLYDSGISEEMIAEQVDLNLATVKSLIKIITTK